MTFIIVIAIIISLSIILAIHELGHFIVAKLFGIEVEEFGLGFPPRLLSKKIKGTVYSINAVPFGAMVKINSGNAEDKKSFNSKPLGIRVLVMLGGIFLNLVLGWLIISYIFMIGASDGGIFIAGVSSSSPAEISGIKINDKIINVKDFQNNQLAESFKIEEFQKFVAAHSGEKINLGIQRGKEKLDFEIIPRVNPPTGEGALGISLTEAEIIKKQGFFTALFNGLKTTGYIFGQIFVFIFALIKSAFLGENVLAYLTGPVGAVKIGTQFAYLGFVFTLRIFALISINLAAFNLIPFPALDGGRLWFFLIEKIKKSPVSQKTQNIVDSLGFSLLMVLSIIILIKDIISLF